LYNDSKFKQLSLEDNVYFTLRDIFLNSECIDDAFTANNFNHRLTGGIRFEDRDESFTYTNVLDDLEYLSRLVSWLEYFKIYCFEFKDQDDASEEINMDKYIKFDDWWDGFVKLRNQLEENLIENNTRKN
jgi:hypothetical protein